MIDHKEANEPEFEDDFERPAWWHRQQSRIIFGDPYDALIPRSFHERFPPLPEQRKREIDAAYAAGRNPCTGEEIPVRAIPRPARTGGTERQTPRKWSPKTGEPHTYLVSMEGSHLVKIGIATDPERRLKYLQTGQPMDLFLLWSVPGEYECALHERFAKYRHRGEWFDLRELGDPVAVVTDAINEIRASANATTERN